MAEEFSWRQVVELERVFEEIRRELKVKAEANPQVQRSLDAIASRSAPPSGLTAEQKGVGTFEVSWNPANVPDLRYYELVVGEGLTFENPRTIRTGETFHTFQGDARITYFARVRTIAQSGAVSAFTEPVNTETGIVGFQDLVEGAAARLFTDRQVVFSPAAMDHNSPSTVYGAAQTDDTTADSIIIPFVILRTYLMVDNVVPTFPEVAIMEVELLRNGMPVGDSSYQEMRTNADGVVTVAGFTLPDEPGEGSHTYAIRITLDRVVDATIDIIPEILSITLLELTQGVSDL